MRRLPAPLRQLCSSIAPAGRRERWDGQARGIGGEVLKDHLVAWNYYQTTENERNTPFVEAYKAAFFEQQADAPAGLVGEWAAARPSTRTPRWLPGVCARRG